MELRVDPPADMKGKELERYWELTSDEQRIGYLEYRAVVGLQKPRTQKHVLMRWWSGLKEEDQQTHIDTALRNVNPKIGGNPDYSQDLFEDDSQDDDYAVQAGGGLGKAGPGKIHPKDRRAPPGGIGLRVEDLGRLLPPQTLDTSQEIDYDAEHILQEINTEIGTQVNGWSWRFFKELYNLGPNTAGCYNVVALYVLVDENRTVQDRIAVKRHISQSKKDLPEQRAEFDVGQLMQFCKHCLRYLARSESETESVVMTYSEYCEHGDLKTIYNHYVNDSSRRQVPEPFVWYFLLGLSEALYALNTGHCAANLEARRITVDGTPREDWNAYIHGDIKLENVFLAIPEDPWLAYPRPLLGDFDSAMTESDRKNHARNPRSGFGTLYWQAPETLRADLFSNYPINDKTDIYSVGLVAWSLMHASMGNEASELRKMHVNEASFGLVKADTFPTDEGQFRWNGMYSHALTELVKKCLKLQQKDRPGFVELRQTVLDNIRRLPSMTGDFYPEEPARHLRLIFKRNAELEIGDTVELPTKRRRRR